MYKLKVKMI